MMAPTSPLAFLGLGFVLGLRHALDVDHLAAVSTIVSQRRGLWRSSLVGAVWGLGHTASLLAAGVAVIALHTEIPPQLAQGLELAVAVMLIGLGLNLLRTIRRGGTVHVHVHEHGGHHHHVHAHVHAAGDAPADPHHHPVVSARRPFLVGVVHGLAGSAALMLAVLATIPDPTVAFAYIAVFGAGSIGGMMMMSTLVGLPFVLAGERFARIDLMLRTAAGVGSIAVGVLLAWEIGVDSGLLA
jgi:ABC-type nickel/cobalt efflux system permease component RcnA